MVRVYLGLADDARLETLHKKYGRMTRIDRKHRKDCYLDFGMRELYEMCPGVKWPVLGVKGDGKIEGIIFANEFASM